MARAIDKSAYFRKIEYTPHPEQMLYHGSRARFKVPVCGRRFGKSTMAARDAEPELLLPNRMYWIAGPNYDLGEKEFRVIWNDMIVKLKLGQDRATRMGYSKKSGSMFIQFPWNTRVEVRSGDHPESLVGEGLHGVIVAEAAKHREDAWHQYIRPALADYGGWATFSSTPEGMNWLYSIWKLGQDPNFPEYESWRFPSWMNTFVYPGGENDPEIELLRRTMATDVFLQEIAADFTAFSGKVYTDFDDLIHVQDDVGFNPSWPNYIGFDWGYTRPLAAIEFQVTPRDQIRIWREHYVAYKTLDEHFDTMRNREQPPGYHLDMTFGDSADPEAVVQTSQKFAPCLADPMAKQNWREGIDLVRTFLRERETGRDLDEYGTPEQEPGLIVDRSCTNTIHEFNNYKGKGNNAQDPIKESPYKKDDHAMDALRYSLMHLFALGANSHLSDVYDMPVDAGKYKPTSASSGLYMPDQTIYMPLVESERGIFSMSPEGVVF